MEIPATETVTVKLPSNGVHPIYVTNDRCTTKTKILDAEVGKTYVITDDNLGECAGPPEYKITPTINTNLELYSITYKVNNEQTFHPLTEVITQDQEFTIQFYVSNPILNDCTNVKLGAATEVKKPTTITLSVTDIEAGKCSVPERYYVNMVNNLDKAIYTVQYKASNSKPEEPRKNFPQGGNANLNSNQFFKVTLYITTNIPECPSTTLEILSSGSSDRLSITQANLEEKCQYKAPPVPTEEEKPEKPTEEKPEKPTEVETGGEKPTDDETGGSSLNEETKKFMEELQKLIKSDYEKIETNDTLIEVSNKNVEIIAKSDITVKSTGLSVGKILIDEGTVNVEGPFLGFVEIGKGKIVMKCNAETQTMPFGFISKKGSSKLLSVKELKAEKIDIEIQMEGSPKEDFILGVGSVSDFQPNLISKYESREATANDQITIGGYKNVQFEAFSNSQFPIKNTAVLEVTKENKTNTTPTIIGVVVAVVVIIIIVVVVVIIIKKKKKDNSTSSK